MCVFVLCIVAFSLYLLFTFQKRKNIQNICLYVYLYVFSVYTRDLLNLPGTLIGAGFLADTTVC